MVLARVIEPVSKADTVRVLDEVGVPAPSVRTLFRALGRCSERDYRGRLAEACLRHSQRGGPATVVLYDVTMLHFEAENEDALRKVGMSKERRVDPQIQVGLLVDRGGFPLEVHCFEGNKAETKTLLPILTAFSERHQVSDLVVVADAGMLSAANLNGIEDAGVQVHRGFPDQHRPLRPGCAPAAARERLRRPADPRIVEGHGHAEGRAELAGGLSVPVSRVTSVTTERSTPWSTAPRRSLPGRGR